MLVLQEAALLQATWGAALEIDGREAEALECYRSCLTRALAMMDAISDQDDEMLARAEVMEAYVLGRLGEYRLAEARMWAATSRFPLRPELPEVLLAKLGLGAAYARDEQFAKARQNLQEAADEAIRKDRWVWSLTALAQLATVDVLEYGPHPAVGRWQALARETTQRLWGERESRFVALRDRMSLRALTEEANRLGQAALMDPLTGLGNRRLLDRRLRVADGELCVVFVDVDHFKAVNDTFGHDIGDGVLIRVAAILQDLTRADDTVVRYGGDEFVLLIPGVGQRRGVGDRLARPRLGGDRGLEQPGPRPVRHRLGRARRRGGLPSHGRRRRGSARGQAGRARPGLVRRGSRRRLTGLPPRSGRTIPSTRDALRALLMQRRVKSDAPLHQ